MVVQKYENAMRFARELQASYPWMPRIPFVDLEGLLEAVKFIQRYLPSSSDLAKLVWTLYERNCVAVVQENSPEAQTIKRAMRPIYHLLSQVVQDDEKREALEHIFNSDDMRWADKIKFIRYLYLFLVIVTQLQMGDAPVSTQEQRERSHGILPPKGDDD